MIFTGLNAEKHETPVGIAAARQALANARWALEGAPPSPERNTALAHIAAALRALATDTPNG